MNTRTAQTPMAFVRAMVAAYGKYGVDPREALRAAGIAPATVRRIDGRITADQMEAISGHAMRELNDEALGWFSRPMPWGSHGLLCRASLPSSNLGVALSRWCRHHGLLVDDVSLHFSVANKVARVEVDERRDLGVHREFCLVTMLRNLHGVACWLVDSHIPLAKVAFPFEAPTHREAYALMFRAQATFSEAHASISFPAEYLNLPVRRDDRDLRQMLRRPLPLIVFQYRRDRLLARRVLEFLRTNPPELSTAELVASALNTSTRSLFRQLKSEGASLQRLKDEVRHEIAIHQLSQSSRQVKQIAAAAGFRSLASFNRAFRQWTGFTPGEYRTSLRNP